MDNFAFADSWTPAMFKAFMFYCWTHDQVPNPRAAKYWLKKVYVS